MSELSPLLISLQVSILATVLVLITALPIAWFVTSKSKVPVFWDCLFSMPMVLPPTVVGFLLLISFGNRSPLGLFLKNIGLPMIFSLRGAILASAVVSFPLLYRSGRAAFDQMNFATLACARTLGVSELKIFFCLLIPEISPAVLSGLVLTFCRALGEFGATSLIAGNIPGVTQTMSLAIYTAVSNNDFQAAYRWSFYLILFSILLMLFSELFLRRYKRREQRLK